MEQMQEKGNSVISRELIFIDEEFSTKNEVIAFIVKQAEATGYVSEFKDFYDSVQRREAEVPTAIGYQIAIPHGKTGSVKNPFIAFLRTKDEFQWTADNEEMVRLVFLIGVPQESPGKLHLKFISQLSKKLLDDEFREKLLNQTDKGKIFEQLNSIEI
ncbi:PTS sugar transporter subunit IIA [Trichococcus ilyis]|jgi:fructose-specific phosphotransferase system IIA component|uniref:PTS system, fructose-specific IIA component n=1 Tax=Trichococcus ilyis TaxID=640938 RepID=A0A143YUN1_9LACT|nr:PTS sugar transporter subunit IIA [Trichococcus ilyis]CZQ96341.1 phosphoenolpyruvate-dependent sugar phosphotransferase system eiia 2 [Trichococcus ilyis]SEJ79008.1 PTS system, fructose-specific IIA component [Trichococcus ilyis]